MRCRTLKLMMACAALSLSNCATPLVTDSYCSVYQPIVVAKGDGKIVASEGVKRRLLANELTYRAQCQSGT